MTDSNLNSVFLLFDFIYVKKRKDFFFHFFFSLNERKTIYKKNCIE